MRLRLTDRLKNMIYRGAPLHSIQKRVFLIIMAGIAVCSLILSVVFTFEANHLLMEREFVIIERSLSSTATNIDHYMDNANYIYDIIASEGSIQGYMSANYADINERYAAELDVTAILNAYKMYSETVGSVSLLGKNGLQANSQSYSFQPKSLVAFPWYREAVSDTSPKWYVMEDNPVLVSVEGSRCVSLGGPIRNLGNGKLLGVLFVDLSERKLSECINSAIESRTLLVDAQGNELLSINYARDHVYQTDDDGIEREHFDALEAACEKPVRLRGGTYLFAQKLKNDWYVVDVIPNVVAGSGITIVVLVVLITMCIILLASYAISKKLSVDITQRLVKMKVDIERVESGDFSVVMDTGGNDEITVLAREFNSLLKYINVLITTLYEKQEELAEAELKTLQAQINPHFLYNTLDTVVWMARFNRTDDIETIVAALTTYFRFGLNAGEDIITLAKEIEHMKSYLTIQMYRYYQVFTYDIRIDEAVKADLDMLRIPKLTLQPLVENAIYHGIKEKPASGLLTISIRAKGDRVVIAVTDNGKGMDEAVLARLNHIREADNGATPIGYGLKNVDNRIRKRFGELYGLSFESRPNEGTTVYLTIPGANQSS